MQVVIFFLFLLYNKIAEPAVQPVIAGFDKVSQQNITERMAELSLKEFAAMCRTTAAVVRTNIHRGKIAYIKEDKIIDTSDPLNAAFFEKYTEKAEKEDRARKKKSKVSDDIDELYNEVVSRASDEVKEKTRQKERKQRAKKSAAESKKKMDWTERASKADTLLKERKAEIELLKIEKMNGKLLPIDLVFRLLNIHNRSIFTSFQRDIENIESKFCDILAGGDRQKLSMIHDEVSKILDNSVSEAKEMAEKDIDNAIDEYAQTRSRGERK
tara:strand:- start:8885 stop:9694 length:810 start_codon:yes stop_codon:yes gene_type:complete